MNMPARDYFNAFDDRFDILDNAHFAGLEVGGRIVHRSADGTHLTIVTHYPKGTRGRYGAEVDYCETFYVIRGTGRRILPDGAVVEMKEGDAIYVAPGIDVEYIYDPGFADIAFFWSDKPLPPGIAADLPYPRND